MVDWFAVTDISHDISASISRAVHPSQDYPAGVGNKLHQNVSIINYLPVSMASYLRRLSCC